MDIGTETLRQSRLRIRSRSTVDTIMIEDGSRLRSTTSNADATTTTPMKMARWMIRPLETRNGGGRRGMGFATFLRMILATMVLFTTVASAARIKAFSNCLSDKIIKSPVHLQFHPLHVAAAFGASGDHNLAITIWGNVTGRSAADPTGEQEIVKRSNPELYNVEDYDRLISEGGLGSYRRWLDDKQLSSPFWKRAEPEVSAHLEPLVSKEDLEREETEIIYETTGFIEDTNVKANQKTTLVTTISVLNYSPFKTRSAFCNSSTAANGEGACPLRPALINLNEPYNISSLPSFSIKQAMHSAYPFASISVTARIQAGTEDPIGCVQIEITPSLGESISATLRWLPFSILLLVAIGTILAAIYNPWNGTADIFRWSSNSGMDEDMLRLVTPGFGDCLQYLQFVVLTGSLTLSYPGFYQPVISKAAWSVLLFNTTFVSDHGSRTRLIDNVYAPNGTTGFENLSQLIGLGEVQDIWPCFMVYFAIVVGAVLVGCAVLSLVRVAQIKFFDHQEEDLRSKRWPFFGGMIIRLVFNYLVQPLVAFSVFQLVISGKSPIASAAVAGILLVVVILGAGACLYRIATEKPRHALYDQLETLLLLGPLYNTYSEKSTLFCFVQVIVILFRSLAIGAAQPSGIAQLVLLAICEIILILTLVALRPFSSRTSMNLYYAFFSAVRLLAVLFSVAFIPSMDVEASEKGWIGYVILIMHGIVLVFGFFLNAVQTIVEVLLRMTGVGDDGEGASRGALVQVFGMRQLSRRTRKTHHDIPQTVGHEKKPSATIMSDVPIQGLLETGSNSGSNQMGHSRSGSTVMTPITPNSGMTLGLTGAAAKPAIGGGGLRINTGTDTSTPFYRAPRIRSATLGGLSNEPYSPGSRSRASWGSQDWGTPRFDTNGNMMTPAGSNAGRVSGNPAARNSSGSFAGSKGPGDGLRPYSDDWDVPTAINTNPHSGSGTPSQLPNPGPSDASRYEPSITGAGRPKDYFTTRESDFYYGVSRGPPLNNHAQNRRVGTGPADPTGPISVAKSWFRRALGKTTSGGGHKGFEVVRSAKAPEELLKAMEADAKAKRATQLDPAAGESASLARNQDPDSDAEDRAIGKPGPSGVSRASEDEEGEGYPTRDGRIASSDAITALPAIHLGNRFLDDPSDTPPLPRRSSKRRSQAISPAEAKSLLLEVERPVTASNRLPFSGTVSEASSNGGASHSHSRSPSMNSFTYGLGTQGDVEMALSDATEKVKRNSGRDSTGQRPASMGNVTRHRMHDSLRVPPEGLNTGSSAELVDGRPSESDDLGAGRL